MLKKTTKLFLNSGMDTNSAKELIAPEDFTEAYNVRGTGTSEGEAGYLTNIESTEIVNETTGVPSGIKKVIGGREFDSIKKAVAFRYNSFGFHQILVYDYQANDFKAIYTDKTDSGGQSLMPLDPQFYVCKPLLVNDKYLVWTDGQGPIGFTDLDKLASGAYGTVTAEDFSLIKPQPLQPPVGYYTSDTGKASNFVKQNLFQFNAMWFGEDYTSSAWSTWSKRIIPGEEATPSIGDDVSANNCIIVSVPVGSQRVQTINIGARFGDFGFSVIKSVERAYAVSLPNTSIDIDTEVLESYDPATGLYSFIFYNDSTAVPVAPTETDLPYDYVPLNANAAEILNGNIIALGGVTEGYDRPVTGVELSAIGYDPNLSVPPNEDAGDPPFIILDQFAGSSGSGEGNHKRRMYVGYTGVPHEGDVLTIVLADIRDWQNRLTYTYTVPASQDENLTAVMASWASIIPNSSIDTKYIPQQYVTITFVGPPYFGLQRAAIFYNNPGATISQSIHSILDNSSYQLALSYRDKYGRFFPLLTNNSFIVKTPSYAQIEGLAVSIQWSISDLQAPEDAVDYQWLITKNNTTSRVLDVLGGLIHYVGEWNAVTNTPGLVVNPGAIGDTYQVTIPNATSTSPNLGNGSAQYNTGDFIVSNGQSWDTVKRDFADLTSTNEAWVFKLNPLNLFNTTYASSGQDTVLTYDFVPNDKCTLHYYYEDPDTKVWLNEPCVELAVLDYDPATFLLKTSKSSAIDIADLAQKNVYLRIWSPKQNTQADTTSSQQTVWYEIGERFTITNGNHDALSGIITDGDVYFKTRQYQGNIDPNEEYPILATDFNFSDFYESAFTSYGRPRTFLDTLERTQRKAIIRHSQNYILGSRNNGLTRFFAEAIYGDADGQTSSSWGSIGVLWQRGTTLVIIQEGNTGYAPINLSILEDMAQQKQYAISQKLINNIRYNITGDIGIGQAKESFCYEDAQGWFIDPNKAEVYQIGLDGLSNIGGKMGKYFKQAISSAYFAGKKLVMYYDRYYKEVVFATETAGGMLTQFTFTPLAWKLTEDYTVAPGAITPANGAHSTVAYDSGTGIATYTPSAGYVGNDTPIISFTAGGSPVTKNVCLNWTAGSTAINPFYFADVIDIPLSTLTTSNSVLISGNTIPAPISVTGGEYSINGGAFTSSAGTVAPGSTVQVRRTSSASYNTPVNVVLTVGGYSDTFTIRTIGFATLNYSLDEQVTTFVDCNLQIKINGAVIPGSPFLSPTSGTMSIPSGSTLSVEVFSEEASEGINPKDRLRILKDASEVYNNNSAVPVSPGILLWSAVIVADSIYDVSATSDSYAIVNYFLSQLASPYIDANLDIKDNTIQIVGSPFLVDTSGTYLMPAGHTLSSETLCETTPVGASSPKIRQVVTLDGALEQDTQDPAVAGASIVYSDTAQGGSTYNITSSTFEGGAPPVPSCPTRRMVFQICNSNAAKDDNFDIYLNGTAPGNYIGAVDLSLNDYIGSVFVASLTPLTITDPDFVCPMGGMVVYEFDPALVVGGINTIYMVNTQNNGNDNLGRVGVRNYELSGSNLINPCVVADLQFGLAPSGTSFELKFDYTACCPGDI